MLPGREDGPRCDSYPRRCPSYSGEVTGSEDFNKQNAGLCADCQHARRIESDRGSVFVMCELSFTDSRFPKYPRLPVLACDGYERKTGLD
jgi:hypothetical protein